MARIKGGVAARRRHKKIMKLARGYRGARSRTFRAANESVLKALFYARRDRRARKRDFRRLWIARINAAARSNGLTYSRFMNGLKRAGVGINRKMLAEIAVHDNQAFADLVALAKDNLAAR
ncbi:MAG: 50S ribosomal protein L20 [Firmicutes bacterium]|jgi:large subunit ribosomal protein L20|nr:50S ribosomal protein L20 [Bacillota bacterium]